MSKSVPLSLSGDVESFLRPWTQDQSFIPTVAVYGIAFVVGICGNCLVIFAVLADRWVER